MSSQLDAYSGSVTVSAGVELELLAELGRATTVYHEAPPERLEIAREEYERVLVKFKTRRSQAVEPSQQA